LNVMVRLRVDGRSGANGNHLYETVTFH